MSSSSTDRPAARVGEGRSGTVPRVVIDAPGELRLETRELPDEPPPGEALLRMIRVGVCGSDLHVLAGHHPFVSYPVLPGHEVVARVERLGGGVEPRWLGARVALEPSLTCGSCRACRRGRYNICEELRVMGFQEPGGMAAAFHAPVGRLHRLPPALSDDAAALVEPTAVAVHATNMAGIGRDERLAVVGAGTIGLLCAQVARARGAVVELADLDPERRSAAHGLNFRVRATLAERGYDAVIECVGKEGALRSAIAACRKGGTVVIAGVHGSEPRLQAGLIQDFEIGLRGTLMYTGADYREAIGLLMAGAVDTAAMICASFPLVRAPEAFALAAQGGRTLKVLLTP